MTNDVYLILGNIEEDRTDRNTADGEPLDRRSARRRLGRMICADSDVFHHKDAVTMAQSIAEAQLSASGDAAIQVGSYEIE